MESKTKDKKQITWSQCRMNFLTSSKKKKPFSDFSSLRHKTVSTRRIKSKCLNVSMCTPHNVITRCRRMHLRDKAFFYKTKNKYCSRRRLKIIWAVLNTKKRVVKTSRQLLYELYSIRCMSTNFVGIKYVTRRACKTHIYTRGLIWIQMAASVSIYHRQ